MGGGLILWLVVAIVVIVFVVGGLALLGLPGAGTALGRGRQLPAEQLLRERYARGEIGRQSFQDALSDVLKDRYLRGELTSEEFEERVAALIKPSSDKLPSG